MSLRQRGSFRVLDGHPEVETSFTCQMLSDRISFRDANWAAIPNEPGVYVIWDGDEVVYVGMSGRNGKGGLRNRLRDHSSGQIGASAVLE